MIVIIYKIVPSTVNTKGERMAHFKGFTPQTINFLRALTEQNTKEFFEKNRRTYEVDFLAPAQEFVCAMAQALADIDPNLQAIPKINKSIKRLHRDMRFSADKTPFNPRLHLLFWHGERPKFSPAFHMVMTKDHLGIGTGLWAFNTHQLTRYRAALEHKTAVKHLDNALQVLESRNAGARSQPELKRAYGTGEDCTELHRRYKSLVVKKRYPLDKALFSDRAIEFVLACFIAQKPVYDWIIEYID